MSIGTGVGLLLAGAILYWAVEFNLPYVFEDALGVIMMLAGLAVVAASAALAPRSHGSVGAGLGLTAAGAVLTWAVEIDLPYVYDGSLGIILMFAGIIAVAAAVGMDVQRSRSRHAVEYRQSDGSTYRGERGPGRFSSWFGR
jgi:hypothetical protein